MNGDDKQRAVPENPLGCEAEGCATPDPLLAATLQRIQRSLTADLHLVRPLARKRYLFAIFAGIFLCAVAGGVYRMGAFGLAAMSPLESTTILSLLAISTCLLSYSLLDQMAPDSRQRIPARALPWAIILVLLIAIVTLFPLQHEDAFWGESWFCLHAGLQVGIVTAIPIWLVLRRGAIISEGTTGAAAGLLAGLAGTTVLELHCPNMDLWHILLSHFGVALCAPWPVWG